MINADNYQELSKIANKANEFLIEHDCPEFSITGVNWDEEGNAWCVSYESDYSNHEFINVWVKSCKNGYVLGWHSFEKPEINLF